MKTQKQCEDCGRPAGLAHDGVFEWHLEECQHLEERQHMCAGSFKDPRVSDVTSTDDAPDE